MAEMRPIVIRLPRRWAVAGPLPEVAESDPLEAGIRRAAAVRLNAAVKPGAGEAYGASLGLHTVESRDGVVSIGATMPRHNYGDAAILVNRLKVKGLTRLGATSPAAR